MLNFHQSQTKTTTDDAEVEWKDSSLIKKGQSIGKTNKKRDVLVAESHSNHALEAQHEDVEWIDIQKWFPRQLNYPSSDTSTTAEPRERHWITKELMPKSKLVNGFERIVCNEY